MIPFQRCGYFYIDSIEKNKVVLRIEGEFEESVDEVADYDEVCLWVITEMYDSLYHGQGCRVYSTHEEAQKAAADLSKSSKELLQKYHGLLSTTNINTKEQTAFLKTLEDVPQTDQTHIYLASLHNEEEIDFSDRDRLLSYGFDKTHIYKENNGLWAKIQLIQIQIPISKEGFEYWSDRIEKKDYFSEAKLFLSENNNGYHLYGKIFIPALKKQLEELLKFALPSGSYQTALPKNEEAFNEIAKQQISNRKLYDLLQETHASHGYISFEVKNIDLISHLREGMVIYG